MLSRPLSALLLLLLTQNLKHAWAWTPATRRSTTVKRFLSATRSTQRQQPIFACQDFDIRDCTYAELGPVADIIMASFYVNTTNPWKQFYRMGELNRIQQGFSYGDKSQHRMLIAVYNQKQHDNKERIVGFCDLDARKPNRPTCYTYNPRPYLSDLCIHPDFRKRGIARALVETCEDYCIHKLPQDQLFIRVEENNVAALTMYQKMGYVQIKDHDTVSRNTILLHKNFTELDEDEGSNAHLLEEDAIQQQASS